MTRAIPTMRPSESRLKSRSAHDHLVVRALRTMQADGVAVYTFFLPGADLLQVAEISRIHRDADRGGLRGFQRREIRDHVRSITTFLDSAKSVLFPNAVLLAIAPSASFVRSRGEKPTGEVRAAEAGTLYLPKPLRDGDPKSAWVIDGQQRCLALAQARNRSLPVPVVAFASEDLALHRQQFILVNKAKPLSSRLIDELLPEVAGELPRDLAPRRIPSALCDRLNTDPASPFHGLVRRPSDAGQGGPGRPPADAGVVIDSALVAVIRASIASPLGALAPYKGAGDRPTDAEAMYRVLVAFWSAVRETFPDAWGLPPSRSRLMHSAGLQAMGCLMDRIMSRVGAAADPRRFAREALGRIAPHCHWTEGHWTEIGRGWDEVQNISRDVRALTDHLARLDHQAAFTKAVA
jgi:DGQHR domain-containing protein